MTCGIGAVLVKRSLCSEEANAEIATPLLVFLIALPLLVFLIALRLLVCLIVSSTVLHVLVVPTLGGEGAVTGVTVVRHFCAVFLAELWGSPVT